MRPDASPGRWAGPALALATLLLITAVAEGVLRFQHARRLERILGRDPTRELCTEPDPRLVYRYAANRCGSNRAGYRDDDRTRRKPPGVRRLVVIGDSIAVGSGITVEERFDRVTVRALAERGVDAEAVNLARTGYSTSQELLVLETEGYTYEPDLVVWSYVLNDPADPVHHNANGRLGRFYLRPSFHVAHAIERGVFKLRERWAGRRCPDEFHTLLHCVYAEQVSDSIRRLGELSRREDTPTLFVIHPVFEAERGFRESSFAKLHARLADEAREAGLDVLDLLDVYGDESVDALRQPSEGWFDPWHPNPYGHALAGEAIADEAARLLSRDPPRTARRVGG